MSLNSITTSNGISYNTARVSDFLDFASRRYNSPRDPKTINQFEATLAKRIKAIGMPFIYGNILVDERVIYAMICLIGYGYIPHIIIPEHYINTQSFKEALQIYKSRPILGDGRDLRPTILGRLHTILSRI